MLVDSSAVRRFLEGLARTVTEAATVYLVGGATAVSLGWRASTIDIDLLLEPEVESALRALPGLKIEHQINVELASPLDFLPALPGWRDRSPFLVQLGQLTVRHFDLYSQALAKLERGFEQDRLDVQAMIARGLVEPEELSRLLEAIAGDLYRFPAVDEAGLRAKVAALRA